MSRDFFLLLVARVAQLMLALVSVRVSTAFLSAEQYGTLALLTGIVALCGLFLVNPVGQHVNRHTHEWFADGSLIAKLSRYNWYIVTVSLLGAMMILVWYTARGLHDIEFMFLTCLTVTVVVYAGTWNTTLVPMLNMIGLRRSSVALSVVTTLIALTVSSLLTFRTDSGVRWLLGQAAGFAIGAVIAKKFLERKVKAHGQFNAVDTPFLTKETLLSFCIPLALATGFMWLTNNGYRFVVEWGWGSRALGFMAVGFAVVSSVWGAIETLVVQFLYPHFYKSISSGDPVAQQMAYSNLLNTLMPIYLLLFAATLVSSGWIIAVLTDQKFHEAYIFTIFGAVFEWCRAMSNLFSQASQVTKRTSYMILPYAVAGSVALIGCMLMAYVNASLETVALVLVISGILLLTTMGWQMSNLLRIEIEWRPLASACLAAIILSSTVALLVGIRPLPFFESLTALALIGLIVSASILVFLRNSRAYVALVSVQLI